MLGRDKYSAAGDMLCGNGSDRTQHPSELWGCDWQEWGSDFEEHASVAGEPCNAIDPQDASGLQECNQIDHADTVRASR